MVNYKRQMGALISGQMLSLLLGFVLPLILVRILSKHDYGLYAQLNVILAFCTTFFSFGFSSELYYSYPTASESNKKILVSQSFMLLLLMGVVAFAILYIPFVRQHIASDDEFLNLYNFLTLSVLFSVPEIIITVLYVLNHDNKTSALFLPSMTILRVLLILGCYWIEPSIKSVFIAVFLSCLLKFLYVLIYTLKTIKNKNGIKILDVKILRSQLFYSIPLGIANSTRILVQQLDKLIILSFVSPAVYAVYSIAFYGVPGLAQVYLSISQVYIPRMATSYKNSDIKGLMALYHSMVSKTLSYTVPVVLVIMLFADPIIPFVFSDKYIDSIPYFRIYLLTFIVQSVGCGNLLRATGETRRSLMAYIYTAIIMLPFTYFAIKYFYLNGAIVSATLGAVLPKILLSVYDSKAVSSDLIHLFPWNNILKIVLISFVCLIPFIFIYFYVGHSNFLMSLVWIFLYLCFVSIMQIFFDVFFIRRVECIAYINNFFRR